MQYFVTVKTHPNNAKGEWVADQVFKRLNKTIVSDTNFPEMEGWIDDVIEAAKENFPRCKVDLITHYDGNEGSAMEGHKILTYQTRQNADYPDVRISFIPARVELF